MARPKLDIDEDEVYKLAKLGASNVDIGDFFSCDEGTIRKRFSETLAKGRAERRNTLREWQWQSASNGNVAMLIWLGKQELGQSDKVESQNAGTTTIRVEYVDRRPDAGPSAPGTG